MVKHVYLAGHQLRFLGYLASHPVFNRLSYMPMNIQKQLDLELFLPHFCKEKEKIFCLAFVNRRQGSNTQFTVLKSIALPTRITTHQGVLT